MEQKKHYHSFINNYNHLPFNLIRTIISYLSLQDLQKMLSTHQQTQIHTKNNNKISTSFINIVSLQFILKSYINFTDRSVYFTFYQSKQHINLQQLHHVKLSYHNFYQSFLTYKLIIQSLKKQLNDFDQKQQIIQSIQNTLRDPELPFPKMRKNKGMYCNSSIQFLLIDKYFDQQETFLDNSFEDLKNYVQVFLQHGNQSKQKIESSQMLKISEIVSWKFSVSEQKYSQFLLQNSILHNCAYLIISLIKNHVKMILNYLKSYDDYLARFVQFCLRFCIFRNLIISLEEKFSWLFDLYNNYVQNLFSGDDIKKYPSLSIWKCSLTIWYQSMKVFHEQNQQVYQFLLIKYLSNSLITQLDLSLQEFPSEKISFINKFQLKNFQFKLKQYFYCFNRTENYGLQTFLEKDFNQFQQILKQYIQYMVDISISNQSVHWCGHSEHQLDFPFFKFQTSINQIMLQYFKQIQKLTSNDRFPSTQSKVFKLICENSLRILQKGILKPVTLKKIVNILNDKFLLNISNDLGQSDQLLKFSNKKHGIDIQKTQQACQIYETLKSISFKGKTKQQIIKMFSQKCQ